MNEAPGELARRSVSRAGIQFIGGWEGFRGDLYNDPLGHCTIGYGHLVHRGRCNGSEPPQFKRGITHAQGLDLLQDDVRRFADAVDVAVRVALRQHQFDALVSFAYNVGTGAFSGSTLLRKLNGGDHASVPSELMRWTNNGLPGLVRRRRAEGVLYRDGRYASLTEDDEGVGGPEQRAGAEIEEGPETGAEPPDGEDGPVDEFHDSYGENPVDIGDETDEDDTPLPDPDALGLAAADRLHNAMSIAVEMGFLITATTNGKHSPNSYHYAKPYRHVVIRGRRYEVGRAADIAKVGNPDRLYRQYFRKIEPMKAAELFYDPMGYSWKNGQKVPWVPGGHRDHVHVAF
jgi:GH24 family phage-related lysozyme (muramidase)